jgi:3-methyladenine DNA glycosylase AlkD
VATETRPTRPARPTRPTTEQLIEGLAPFADADRAGKERAYLKSERDFLGVSVPDGRRVVRTLARDAALTAHDDVVATAADWWNGPWWECRRAAVELLLFRVGALSPADLVVLESMIRDGETWALVDGLAGDVVGRIVARDVSDEVGVTLDRWSTDPDSFWVRRASMLALLIPLKRNLDQWPRFCTYAEQMLPEREFFIRKAIGWVLREVSKSHPDEVRAWVEPRLDVMSGVTRREAVKYL